MRRYVVLLLFNLAVYAAFSQTREFVWPIGMWKEKNTTRYEVWQDFTPDVGSETFEVQPNDTQKIFQVNRIGKRGTSFCRFVLMKNRQKNLRCYVSFIRIFG
jgi:hypothetical protein